jgi:hypothetical protein
MLVVSILALGGVARAQNACQADVEKLCSGIPPGGGRVLSCLKANQAKVSPECKQHLAEVAKRVKTVAKACQDDVSKFCSAVKPGKGAVLKCLSENDANLSQGCQEVVHSAQEKAGAFKKACGGDAKKLCQGIPPGQGRVLACLKSREADLSPSCKELMSK